MDKKSLILLLLMLLSSVFNYYSIREEIWSIVWCDNRGKKYGQLKALKNGHSFVEKFKMEYLSSHIRSFQKEYRFWMNFKKAFEIVELALFLICFACVFFVESHPFLKYIMIASVVQAVAVSLWFGFAVQFNNKSKYDRIRIQKKRNH